MASYQRYQDLIPNGRNVTGVCGETDARLCLGSELVPGCGKLNPFGKVIIMSVLKITMTTKVMITVG